MTKKLDLKQIEESKKAAEALAELEGKSKETPARNFPLSGSAATGKQCML